VESAVTIPLEQQINGAEGMKYITSTSGNDGTSQISVTFDLTRDPDLATVDIQNRVNTAQGRLPGAVKAVGITTAEDFAELCFRRCRFRRQRKIFDAVHEQLSRRLRSRTR
jgi:multidrug efflux pump subunit AcrB